MRESIFWLTIIVLVSAIVYPLWGETWPGLLFGNAAQIAGLIFVSRSFNRLQYTCDRKDPLRKALGLCTLGAGIWLLAQTLEIYCELVLKLIAYGTIADAFWIIGYFPLIRGLYQILAYGWGDRDESKILKQKKALFAFAILYVSLFYLLILPQIRDVTQSLPERILDFLYPTLDFVLVGLSAFLLKSTRRGERFFRLSLMLLGGFFLTLIGDAILSLVKDFHSFLYVSVDIYYFTSYFLMAIAADLEFKFTTQPLRPLVVAERFQN